MPGHGGRNDKGIVVSSLIGGWPLLSSLWERSQELFFSVVILASLPASACAEWELQLQLHRWLISWLAG